LLGLYVGTARLGLWLADVEYAGASPIWPPAGIALAALLLFDQRLWPSITLGALLVTLSTGVPFAAALVAALGNTAEALVAAWLLRHVAHLDQTLSRIQDVVSLIICGAVIGPVLSATLGAGSMELFGRISSEELAETWRIWWLGNALSALVITPLFLSWRAKEPFIRSGLNALEAIIYLVVLLAVGSLVIGLVGPERFDSYPITFLPFPVGLWIALRFGQRGATAATFILSALAIMGTRRGGGPFVSEHLTESLSFLQVFIGVTAITTMLFAAAFTERNKAISARDEFIAVASHELKSPLAPMKLQLQSLSRCVEKGKAEALTPDRLLPKLHALERQIDRLASLVRELLDISSLRAGKPLSLDRAEVDLAELAHDVVERFHDELERAGCVTDLRIQVNPKGIWDRLRLEQVLTNLLVNAMKYGKGKPITVTVASDDTHAIFSVLDHGVGIPKEAQARIFERFEQIKPGSASGLGLGLYIARQIVEAHGGCIKLKSTPGKGSLFVVELPLN